MKLDIEKAEEQIYKEQKIVDYDTREFTIEYIVDKYINGVDDDTNEIYVPDYQREFVWDEDRQSKLIESLILGLPIPLIFLAENKDKDNRLEIVDGSQRVRTLAAFVSNKLELKKLEKLTYLNGYTYSELPTSRQRKFRNTPLRTIVMSDKATDEVRNEIFERINRGSDLLKAMEKRKGIYRGVFRDLIYEVCAKNSLFSRLSNIDSRMINRQEKEELILRFFALSDRYKKFPKNSGMAKFLDKYLADMNEKFDYVKLEKGQKLTDVLDRYSELQVYANRFDEMLHTVNKYFPYGFSKNKYPQTSRVTFEAISVGTYEAVRDERPIRADKEKMKQVLSSHKFRQVVSGRYETHKRENIINRIEFIKEALLRND